MRDYRVDARSYHKVRPDIELKLLTLGLSNTQFIKDYIRFFDTLHVMLALAYIEAWDVDYLDTDGVFHIGGTSMGSQYAKDISHMYMSMCFLELVNHAELTRRYLPFLAPFASSTEIREKLPPTDEVRHMLTTVEKILTQLREAGVSG